MQMIIQPQNQEIQSLGQITNPVGQVISNNKLYLRGGLKMLEKCGHLSKTWALKLCTYPSSIFVEHKTVAVVF